MARYAADAARTGASTSPSTSTSGSLLWDGEQARAVLEPIARGASILFCSRIDAGIVFGVPGQGVDVCRNLREEIGAPTVVSTDGRAGTYLSTASEGERVYEIKSVPVSTAPGRETPSWPAPCTAGSTAT